MFAGFGPSEMIEEFPRTRFDEFSENYFLTLISDNVRKRSRYQIETLAETNPSVQTACRSDHRRALTHRYSVHRFDLETKSDSNKDFLAELNSCASEGIKIYYQQGFQAERSCCPCDQTLFSIQIKGLHRRSRSVSAQSTDDLSPILAQTNSASARIPDSSRSRQQAYRLRQFLLTDSSRPQPQSVRGPIAVSSRPVRVPVCGSSLWWSVQQTSKVKGNSKPKNP
ncbi:hypothetical protein DY000_02062264 [Brassica cretica]|uniref:Uncharacterized protein n=1 Tax=Brassica cretica TaxID=69181 RepID=A0ABQ7AP34_BRACR|nr:hypothetical protein DY000_02062264 [Brassica cretica]